ncbi:MAG TPA: helix-turn-helix domain-containing protein [Micromonosporaceae bacterium]
MTSPLALASDQVLPQMANGAFASDPAPLLLTVEEAARLLRIGRTLMYHLISTGKVDSVTVGRLRRVRLGDLAKYAASLNPTPPARPFTDAV